MTTVHKTKIDIQNTNTERERKRKLKQVTFELIINQIW